MVEQPASAPLVPTGPFVQMAAFCDRVLIEQTGLVSLVRVYDQVAQTAVGPEPPEEMSPLQQQLQVFIGLKAGAALGRQNYTLVSEGPSGQRREVAPGSFNFPGGPNSGVNLHFPLNVTFQNEGLYWFDLFVEGQLLTRMPMLVTYQRITQRPATPGPEA